MAFAHVFAERAAVGKPDVVAVLLAHAADQDADRGDEPNVVPIIVATSAAALSAMSRLARPAHAVTEASPDRRVMAAAFSAASTLAAAAALPSSSSSTPCSPCATRQAVPFVLFTALLSAALAVVRRCPSVALCASLCASSRRSSTFLLHTFLRLALQGFLIFCCFFVYVQRIR